VGRDGPQDRRGGLSSYDKSHNYMREEENEKMGEFEGQFVSNPSNVQNHKVNSSMFQRKSQNL
jgi:hypothetical protein